MTSWIEIANIYWRDRGLFEGTVRPKERGIQPQGIKGRYHVVRLIRSDLKRDIFGECFPAPPEIILEYVVATIDVKE